MTDVSRVYMGLTKKPAGHFYYESMGLELAKSRTGDEDGKVKTARKGHL